MRSTDIICEDINYTFTLRQIALIVYPHGLIALVNGMNSEGHNFVFLSYFILGSWLSSMAFFSVFRRWLSQNTSSDQLVPLK